VLASGGIPSCALCDVYFSNSHPGEVLFFELGLKADSNFWSEEAAVII
jgi:hypothetical protein